MTKCAVEGCDRSMIAKGCCDMHYRRMKSYGSVLKRSKKQPTKPCSVEGCPKPMKAKGLCQRHRQMQVRREKPTGRALPGQGLAFISALLTNETNDCVIWPYARQGYGVTYYNGKRITAHRLVCTLAFGPPPFPGAQVAHECGRGRDGCVTKNHLRWDTAKGNTADKWRHGTMRKGEQIYRSKFTEDDIRDIRASKERNMDIAERYGVWANTISSIRRRKSWKHVA